MFFLNCFLFCVLPFIEVCIRSLVIWILSIPQKGHVKGLVLGLVLLGDGTNFQEVRPWERYSGYGSGCSLEGEWKIPSLLSFSSLGYLGLNPRTFALGYIPCPLFLRQNLTILLSCPSRPWACAPSPAFSKTTKITGRRHMPCLKLFVTQSLCKLIISGICYSKGKVTRDIILTERYW